MLGISKNQDFQEYRRIQTVQCERDAILLVPKELWCASKRGSKGLKSKIQTSSSDVVVNFLKWKMFRKTTLF